FVPVRLPFFGFRRLLTGTARTPSGEAWERSYVSSGRAERPGVDLPVYLAGPPGFEPGLTDPESVGLPLPHGPVGGPDEMLLDRRSPPRARDEAERMAGRILVHPRLAAGLRQPAGPQGEDLRFRRVDVVDHH